MALISFIVLCEAFCFMLIQCRRNGVIKLLWNLRVAMKPWVSRQLRSRPFTLKSGFVDLATLKTSWAPFSSCHNFHCFKVKQGAPTASSPTCPKWAILGCGNLDSATTQRFFRLVHHSPRYFALRPPCQKLQGYESSLRCFTLKFHMSTDLFLLFGSKWHSIFTMSWCNEFQPRILVAKAISEKVCQYDMATGIPRSHWQDQTSSACEQCFRQLFKYRKQPVKTMIFHHMGTLSSRRLSGLLPHSQHIQCCTEAVAVWLKLTKNLHKCQIPLTCGEWLHVTPRKGWWFSPCFSCHNFHVMIW